MKIRVIFSVYNEQRWGKGGGVSIHWGQAGHMYIMREDGRGGLKYKSMIGGQDEVYNVW